MAILTDNHDQMLYSLYKDLFIGEANALAKEILRSFINYDLKNLTNKGFTFHFILNQP